MPPKKKSRISNTASPAPPSVPEKPTVTEPDNDSETDEQARDAELVADPWTDDEEIGLFKGLIKWKPAGMHKHFHLLALHAHLLSNGYIDDKASHTRIPGIWAKLQTLYDLEALDEREDAQSDLLHPDGSDDDDNDDVAGGGSDEDERSDAISAVAGNGFELPNDEFGDLMWRARFAEVGGAARTVGRGMRSKGKERELDGGRSESPVLLPELMPGRDSPPVRFTPSFVVAESEEPTPRKRGLQGAKGRTRVAATVGRATGKGAGSKRASRAAESAASEGEEEQDDEEQEEEEEGEEEAESSEGKEESGEESGTPAPRVVRGRGGARGRGRPKGKRRR